MSDKPVGIVILNYCTWEKTLSCVESIYPKIRNYHPIHD